MAGTHHSALRSAQVLPTPPRLCHKPLVSYPHLTPRPCTSSRQSAPPPHPSQQESKVIEDKLTKELVCVEGYQSCWAISR